MADISYELQRIMQAVYGEEVRGSIHDAIDKINQVGEVVLSEGTAVTSPTSPTTGFFDGSFYFNTQTSDLWKCTGTGWLLVGNLEGAGIVSIVKTGTSGLVDTYTVTLTNGNTSTFEVTNGYSPTVTIGTKVGKDQPVTFTDKDGSQTIHIMDGGDGTGASLEELSDVDLDTPTNNQFLRYNGTTQKWENSEAELEELSDIDIDTPTNDQFLRYNGTTQKWENSDTLKDTQDIIAPVEESTTASQPYSEGDELILNNILYKVTDALGIAQGGDLIPSGTGQNIDLAGTIVSQLKALFDGEGDLSSLTTIAKSSLVDAINELVSKEDVLKITSDTEITDFNALPSTNKQLRFYIWNSNSSNRPFNTWGVVLNFEYGTGSLRIQLAIARTGGMAVRGYSSGHWDDWTYISPPPINTLITRTSNDFTVSSVAAQSSVAYPEQTITKSGYTPVFGVVEGGNYADYATFSQKWTFSDGSAKVSGYVGNWSTSSKNIILSANVLWVKNDQTVPT